MKIGIIGAENSHSAAIAKTLNVEKKIPGVCVDSIWGETEEFARVAAEKGAIPHIVKRPTDMLGKIDALIVDHRHARYHLKAAWPYLRAGVPMFIDKPFCYRAREGKAFLAEARRRRVPVASYSTMPLSESAQALRKAVGGLGELHAVSCFGPCDLDSVYGGVFFYGVHQVELVLGLCGGDVASVLVTRNGACSTGQLIYPSGLIATLNFIKAKWPAFSATAVGDKGVHHQTIESDANPYLTGIQRFVGMFRSGKEPRPHAEILRSIQVLEALEKSARTGKKEKVA